MFVDYGLPQPTFETIPGGFAVTLQRIGPDKGGYWLVIEQ